MKSIEDQIRDKNAELKAERRELSALQNELKRKNEALHINKLDISVRLKYNPIGTMVEGKGGGPWIHEIVMETNKYISNVTIYDILKSGIESLFETPSKPASYVDWNKIPKEYNWVASSDWYPKAPFMFTGRPELGMGRVWRTKDKYHYANHVPSEALFESLIPNWDKSLIHRPGAKE